MTGATGDRGCTALDARDGMISRLPWPLVFQVLGVVGAVWIFVNTWEVWLLVFTAVIVAAAILPAARSAERYGIPRGVTVLVVYAAFASIFGVLGGLLWPALREQGQQFMDQLPKLVENLRTRFGDLALSVGGWAPSLPTPGAENVQGVLGALLGNTLKLTAGAVGAVVGLLAILVIAAYMVIDAAKIGQTLLRVIPPAHRGTAAALAEPVLDRIGGYVRGQLVSSVFVGAIIAAGLGLLGLRYALLLGALAAALNVVPFVGATAAAILAILSALNESLALAIGTAVFMTGAQLVEGKFLAPHFVGRATGLHPLVVLVALLGGAHLAGLIGVLVAVPFVAAVWEVATALYVRPRA